MSPTREPSDEELARLSDEELALLVQRRISPRAREMLAERGFAPALWRAEQLCRAENLVPYLREDILANVAQDAARSAADKFNPAGQRTKSCRFRTYLFAAVYRRLAAELRDVRRKERLHKWSVQVVTDDEPSEETDTRPKCNQIAPLASDPGPAEIAERKELLDLINRASARLSDRGRQFLLDVANAKSIHEVALKWEMPDERAKVWAVAVIRVVGKIVRDLMHGQDDKIY
jgi:hypothetical protein